MEFYLPRLCKIRRIAHVSVRVSLPFGPLGHRQEHLQGLSVNVSVGNRGITAGFNESSSLMNRFLNSNIFYLIKPSDLMNNCLGPKRFVKSGDHCI